MKKIVPILLGILTLLLHLNASSQNVGRFPLIRERIVQAKLREIKLKLNMDQEKLEQFRPIYEKYNLEMSDIDLFKLGKLMKVEPDSLTAEEADQLIVNQLKSARRIIDIREHYYKEFRTVLTPQQIVKVYQTEAEMRKKVQEELKRRKLNR